MGDDVEFIRGLGSSGAGGAAGESDAVAERVESVRHGAATALERGLGFVEDYGGELAMLRALVLLEAEPAARVIEKTSGLQQAAGCFDPLGAVFSGNLLAELREALLPQEILGTLEGLAVLADAGGLASPAAERAIGFLMRAQRSDGSWGRSGADAPPDDDLEQAVVERLFATGMLAGYAARTPFVRPEALEWAGRFLARLWSPERVENGRWSAISAFAHFHANAAIDPESTSDAGDEVLQWCGRELERGYRTQRFDTAETVRVLLWCDADALPGSTFDALEMLERLVKEQAADGGFAELDAGGPPGRVGPTLDAMRALRALGNSLG